MGVDSRAFKLIIFDLDGTLRHYEDGELLPGVVDFFEQRLGDEQEVAICTNQGGVGLRYWMELGGFGKPEDYPDEQTIIRELAGVVEELPTAHDVSLYCCFAYQSKKSGKWAPIPPGEEMRPEWNPDNRKPAPGMLLRAMNDHNAAPFETLFVGDSDEDFQAAMQAGVTFEWAKDFFGWDVLPF